jgi:hypothetical protein
MSYISPHWATRTFVLAELHLISFHWAYSHLTVLHLNCLSFLSYLWTTAHFTELYLILNSLYSYHLTELHLILILLSYIKAHWANIISLSYISSHNISSIILIELNLISLSHILCHWALSCLTELYLSNPYFTELRHISLRYISSLRAHLIIQT